MKQLLQQLFDKYNIEYNDEQLNLLQSFYYIVINKNQVMNLTAITEKSEFAVKNILDCVLPIKTIPQNANVVDVGAGAGFPSIPLKILRPDLNIVMVDSLNKRVEFLKETCQKLKLQNISAIHARAEDFAKLNRESFDVCVARAVAKLNTLSEYCLPLVKVGGIMIAYKSLKAEEEIAQSQKAITTLGGKIVNIQNVFIKEIESIRVNVIIKKIHSTPEKYPRSSNKPKTSPIL